MAGWIHEEEEEKEDGKKTRSVMEELFFHWVLGWVRNAVISLGVG